MRAIVIATVVCLGIVALPGAGAAAERESSLAPGGLSHSCEEEDDPKPGDTCICHQDHMDTSDCDRLRKKCKGKGRSSSFCCVGKRCACTYGGDVPGKPIPCPAGRRVETLDCRDAGNAQRCAECGGAQPCCAQPDCEVRNGSTGGRDRNVPGADRAAPGRGPSTQPGLRRPARIGIGKKAEEAAPTRSEKVLRAVQPGVTFEAEPPPESEAAPSVK